MWSYFSVFKCYCYSRLPCLGDFYSRCPTGIVVDAYGGPIRTFPGVVTGETCVGDTSGRPLRLTTLTVFLAVLLAVRLITSLWSLCDGFKKLGNNDCRSRMYLQPDTTQYLTKLTHYNE